MTDKKLACLCLSLIVALGCGTPPAPTPTQPQPQTLRLSSILPANAEAGSSDLTLTLTGAVFPNTESQVSNVVWTDQQNTFVLLNTTFVSDTQLTAVVPAALLTSPKSAQIFVFVTLGPGGDGEGNSNKVDFVVQSP